VTTIFQGSKSYHSSTEGSVVTIGNFDGVHLGHQALLGEVTAFAKARGLSSLVYTFDPAPRDVLRPENSIPRIQSLEDKVAMITGLGLDGIVVEPFTQTFANHEPDWFCEDVLKDRLNAQALFVGWNFRFGRGREGDLAFLNSHGLNAHSVEPFCMEGEIVSSSRIREGLREGDVSLAYFLLGRPHRIKGRVETGEARGRELGFPTANIQPNTGLIPGYGVYAVKVWVGEKEGVFGVANIGIRPTFSSTRPLIEVHLLDFTGDLYGQTMEIDFIARIRDERKFDSRDLLVAQIEADILETRRVLS
jgi:riboflavin kinase/FMN adenylyltransferase